MHSSIELVIFLRKNWCGTRIEFHIFFFYFRGGNLLKKRLKHTFDQKKVRFKKKKERKHDQEKILETIISTIHFRPRKKASFKIFFFYEFHLSTYQRRGMSLRASILLFTDNTEQNSLPLSSF